MPLRRFIVLSSLIVAGCNAAADQAPRHNKAGASPATEHRARHSPEMEALLERLAAARAEFDDMLTESYLDEAAGPVVADARARWSNLFDACGDDGCRRADVADELNRIDFGHGRNSREITGMPWATGLLHVSMPTIPFGEASGLISIFPFADDKILVSLTTVAVPTGRWICSFVGLGHLARGSVIELRSLEEPHERYGLRRVGAQRLSLVRTKPLNVTHCGAGGGIEGTYRVGAPNPETARTLEDLVERRFPEERDRALNMLEQERRGH